MRALSLWQPWASYMACGFKLVETRPWATPYKGLVAIHAAKTREDLDMTQDLWELLSEDARRRGFLTPDPLPLGAIVAVGKLTGCARTTSLVRSISDDEKTLGNYEPGRWGWVFEDIRRLPEPMPYKGERGLWELPAEIRGRLKEAVGL
jgi:hypothetical protein